MLELLMIIAWYLAIGACLVWCFERDGLPEDGWWLIGVLIFLWPIFVFELVCSIFEKD